MATKVFPRLVLAALMALLLAGCAGNASPSPSGGGSPSAANQASHSTSAGTATSTTDAVCAALSDIKTSASTLASDLQARKLAAVSGDIGGLDTAFKNLLDAMSSGAQQGKDQLQSAWDSVR